MTKPLPRLVAEGTESKPMAVTADNLKWAVYAVHEVFPYVPPTDPREDLFIDHEEWERLLTAVWSSSDEDLFWALEATRCLGGALIVEGGRAKIRRGQIVAAEYELIKEHWLTPRLERLKPWLENPKWAGQQR